MNNMNPVAPGPNSASVSGIFLITTNSRQYVSITDIYVMPFGKPESLIIYSKK